MSDIEFPSPRYRRLEKEYDKARFDCFKEYLGCQNADDVYKVITTYDGITRYNGIVAAINSRIAAYTGCSYSEFRNVEPWREPNDTSEELLEYIRKRWDEIYNDEPVADQKTTDTNPVSQSTSDSKIFDTDHFPIGSAVLVTNINCKDICIPDKEAIGIVYNIDNGGKNLVLTTTNVTVGTPLINVRVDQVEQELVKLTRLLPEPPEVENMDYQSAVNELGFGPIDLAESKRMVIGFLDIMTGLKKVITFDPDYYSPGSIIFFKYKTSAAGNDMRDRLFTGIIKGFYANRTVMIVHVQEENLIDDFEINADDVHWGTVEISKADKFWEVPKENKK